MTKLLSYYLAFALLTPPLLRSAAANQAPAFASLQSCCAAAPHLLCLSNDSASAPYQRQKRYCLQQLIGQGNFAQVFLARDNHSGRQVAIKLNCFQAAAEIEDQANSRSQRMLVQGSKNYASLGQEPNPFIANCIECFCQPNPEAPETIVTIMEFCPCLDLNQLLNQKIARHEVLSEYQAGLILLQVLFSLRHLERHGLVHLDLTLKNILFTADNTVKLADFDFCSYDNGSLQTFCGTPYYLAPEVWERRTLSHKTDMWALGCVLHRLVTLARPFSGLSMEDLAMNILNATYRAPLSLSLPMQEILNQLLTRDPRNRPSARELLRSPMLRFFAASFYNVITNNSAFIDKYLQKQILLELKQYFIEQLAPQQLDFSALSYKETSWGDFFQAQSPGGFTPIKLSLYLDQESHSHKLALYSNSEETSPEHIFDLAEFLTAFTAFGTPPTAAAAAGYYEISLLKESSTKLTFYTSSPALRQQWIAIFTQALAWQWYSPHY